MRIGCITTAQSGPLEDPDERARHFDGYSLTLNGRTGRLIHFIENRPVGVSGDYVAYLLDADDFASKALCNSPLPSASSACPHAELSPRPNSAV